MSAMLADLRTSRLADAPHTEQTRAQKRIVIIGGGFAGIAAARALERCDAEVILIDRRNHHIFPTAPISGGDRGACTLRDRGADPAARRRSRETCPWCLAEVTGVDLNSRTVDADCPELGTRKISIRLFWWSPLGCSPAISATTSLPNTRRVLRT